MCNTCYNALVPRRWLVFVHQLPAQPSNGRVKIWRRLQQIGGRSPSRMPSTSCRTRPEAVEDYEWLRGEVVALGGQASVFAVASMSEADERLSRYGRVRKGDQRPCRLWSIRPRAYKRARGTSQRRRPARSLRRIAHRGSGLRRPRPGVDRFATAWLIRRFIDRGATFAFAESPDRYPDAVPFDMYQAGGFRHEGELCTFEVLQDRFGIRDAAVKRIGEIVHDIDSQGRSLQVAACPDARETRRRAARVDSR